MSAPFEVFLDEEHQVIEQRFHGVLTVEQFHELDRLNSECIERLRDQSHILMLVDGRSLKWSNLKSRRAALEPLKRDGNWWMAIWGGDRITRIMTTFLTLAAGTKRVRLFARRDDALEWLLQRRPADADNAPPRP